jgi:hypothetical protein
VTRFEATVEVELARKWLDIFEKQLDDFFRMDAQDGHDGRHAEPHADPVRRALELR